MGIQLSYIFSDRYPLHFVSEQVTTLPKKSDLSISSVGWPKIVYYFSGSAEMTLDQGEIYRISPGTTVVFSGPHGQRYLASDSPTPVQLHALIVCFEPWKNAFSELDSSDWDAELTHYLAAAFSENHHLATGNSSVLWNLAVRIRNECQSNHPMREGLVCELGRLFALQVAEFGGIHPGVVLPEKAALFQKACDAVLASRSPLVDRLEAAASLGVSPSTLDRACRECFGDSFAGYADWVRIERAKLLLQSSRLAISQVAKDLHFGSASAFGRAFKSVTGLTPGEYQQSYHSSSIAWSEAKKGGLVRASAAERCISEVGSWEVLSLPASFETTTPSLLVSLEGEIQAVVGGEKCELGKATPSFLLAQGTSVECRSKNRAAVALLIRGTAQLADLRGKNHGHRVNHHSFWSLLLLREWLKQPATSLHASLSIRSLVRIIWWEALGACEEQEKAAPHPIGHNHRLLISHAEEFIVKHCTRDFTLGEIAWAVGVSEEHLARVFRAETGKTVMAFRLGRRIYRAQGMLVRTRKPITEIAEACGFDSVGYFYRAFKQRVGCTPASFRKKGIGALP